jgi:hypothetical protein
MRTLGGSATASEQTPRLHSSTNDQPEVIADVMTWQPLPHIPALSIPLNDFFRKANR